MSEFSGDGGDGVDLGFLSSGFGAQSLGGTILPRREAFAVGVSTRALTAAGGIPRAFMRRTGSQIARALAQGLLDGAG